jgi:hypothetical protein
MRETTVTSQHRAEDKKAWDTILSPLKEDKVVPQHTYRGAGGEEM